MKQNRKLSELSDSLKTISAELENLRKSTENVDSQKAESIVQQSTEQATSGEPSEELEIEQQRAKYWREAYYGAEDENQLLQLQVDFLDSLLDYYEKANVADSSGHKNFILPKPRDKPDIPPEDSETTEQNIG